MVVCRNPLLAAERTRKRLDLLAATEADLRKVAKAVSRKTKPLRGADQMDWPPVRCSSPQGGQALHPDITDDTFTFARNTDAIEAEGKLDGFYVIRTNLGKTKLAAAMSYTSTRA